MVALLAILGCAAEPQDLAGNPSAGAAAYSEHCQGCHGEDGKLGAAEGVDAAPAADLTVVVPTRTDAELAEVVQDGWGDMAPVDLDPQGVADVIAWLRETFGGEPG